MGDRENACRVLWGKMKKETTGTLGIYGRITLKWILKKRMRTHGL